MPSALLPFGSVKQCPKCGASKRKLKTSYCGGHYCGHTHQGEHLKVYCQDCAWEGYTECADAKKEKA